MKGLSADAERLFSSGKMESHTIVVHAELYRGSVLEASPTVLGGSVTVDADASTRRRCSVDLLVSDELIPRTEGDVLYPGFPHLYLWRGVDWGDSRPGVAPGAASVEPGWELWPLGRFLLLETIVGRSGGGVSIQVAGYDYSKRVERNIWSVPYQIAAGGSVLTEWEQIITDRWSAAEFAPGLTLDGTVSATLFGDRPGGNPWEDVRKLASIAGADTYVDTDGLFVIEPIPDPSTVPSAATFTVGDGTRMTGSERRLDADKGYNQVIVEANPSGGTPLRGVAQNDDPNSATYIGGNYGPVGIFVGDSQAETQAQIDTQAAYLMAARQAASDQVTIQMVPNPALEERDVVGIVDPEIGVDGRYTIDSFTVPLSADQAMSATVRRVP